MRSGFELKFVRFGEDLGVLWRVEDMGMVGFEVEKKKKMDEYGDCEGEIVGHFIKNCIWCSARTVQYLARTVQGF